MIPLSVLDLVPVRVGDTLWHDQKVTFPRIPTFAPEHFSVIRVRDTSKFKQFRKGIAQLDEEGVVQVTRPQLVVGQQLAHRRFEASRHGDPAIAQQ